MSKGILTETGRLQDKLLPAIYFDSSVVIDYWMTEGLRELEPSASALLADNTVFQQHEYIKRLLKTDVRLNKVAEIRQKLTAGQAKATAIVSPICLLELIEWYAEANFRQAVSEAAGVLFIQKKGKKEIADYLNKIYTRIVEKQIKAPDETASEDMLFLHTLLHASFAESHGLHGLLQADIVNFSLSNYSTLYEVPTLYAYMQIGATDIMHILLAQHLGCNYFASFDGDYRRVRDAITGMALLCSPEEILSVL